MSSYELVPFDASHRDDYLRLLAEAWGARGLTTEEFEWWFGRNPEGSILRTALVDGQVAGVGAHMLARMVIGGEERRVSFSCHAVTSPAASGRGIFTELQRALDQAAEEQGLEVVLGFGNEVTNPVFFDRLALVGRGALSDLGAAGRPAGTRRWRARSTPRATQRCAGGITSSATGGISAGATATRRGRT